MFSEKIERLPSCQYLYFTKPYKMRTRTQILLHQINAYFNVFLVLVTAAYGFLALSWGNHASETSALLALLGLGAYQLANALLGGILFRDNFRLSYLAFALLFLAVNVGVATLFGGPNGYLYYFRSELLENLYFAELLGVSFLASILYTGHLFKVVRALKPTIDYV